MSSDECANTVNDEPRTRLALEEVLFPLNAPLGESEVVPSFSIGLATLITVLGTYYLLLKCDLVQAGADPGPIGRLGVAAPICLCILFLCK